MSEDQVVDGRAGMDRLVTSDRLVADGFVFAGAATDSDRISDFEMASDRIRHVDGTLGDIGQGNLFARLTINATGTVAENGEARLIYDNAGTGFGTLPFDADGNGAGATVLLAVLVATTEELVVLTMASLGFL